MTKIAIGTIVKEIKENTQMRVSPEAGKVLTEKLEEYVAKLAIIAGNNAKHAGRVTIQAVDMQLAIN